MAGNREGLRRSEKEHIGFTLVSGVLFLGGWLVMGLPGVAAMVLGAAGLVISGLLWALDLFLTGLTIAEAETNPYGGMRWRWSWVVVPFIAVNAVGLFWLDRAYDLRWAMSEAAFERELAERPPRYGSFRLGCYRVRRVFEERGAVHFETWRGLGESGGFATGAVPVGPGLYPYSYWSIDGRWYRYYCD